MMTPERARQIRRDLEGEYDPGPPRHFDKDGRPIPLWRWVVLFENIPYRLVAETHLWPGIRVSTVWIGLDHGSGRQPLFFETMVFTPHDGWGIRRDTPASRPRSSGTSARSRYGRSSGGGCSCTYCCSIRSDAPCSRP